MAGAGGHGRIGPGALLIGMEGLTGNVPHAPLPLPLLFLFNAPFYIYTTRISMQLAVSLARECPGVPPRVVSLLKAALAGVEQQVHTAAPHIRLSDEQVVAITNRLPTTPCTPALSPPQLEGDSSSSSLSALACYREEIALALRRVEAAVGGGASEVRVFFSCVRDLI